MNTEVKVKWLEALRSGKYEQTDGSLQDERGFCCLGVLLDVIDSDGWGFSYHLKNGESFCVPHRLGDMEFIGPDTLAWCDLDHVQARFLAEMNDSSSTFEHIADYIEEHL